MNVVVAGRVSVGPDIVLDVFDGWVVVVVCWPLDPLVPVDDEVDVDCAAALVATASSNAAAITTRFSIRTSASQTDTHRILLRLAQIAVRDLRPGGYSLAISVGPPALAVVGSIRRPRPPRLIWPPLRPALRASSDVHSCAVPFWCAARPPLLAISRCFSGDMEAKPRRSLRSPFIIVRPLSVKSVKRFAPAVPAVGAPDHVGSGVRFRWRVLDGCRTGLGGRSFRRVRWIAGPWRSWLLGLRHTALPPGCLSNGMPDLGAFAQTSTPLSH